MSQKFPLLIFCFLIVIFVPWSLRETQAEGPTSAATSQISVDSSASASGAAISSSATASAATTANLEVRPLITTPREKPKLEWKTEALSKRRWRFRGSVEGNGRVDLKLSMADTFGGHAHAKVVKRATLELPDTGGKKDFDWVVDVPMPGTDWAWAIEADNAGKWNGYHDFRGCCPAGTTDISCAKDGSIKCGAKTSTTCRCP